MILPFVRELMRTSNPMTGWYLERISDEIPATAGRGVYFSFPFAA
jgi:hypothetical protein